MKTIAYHRWLRPVILVTQETEIRQISVRTQARQIVPETLSQKKKKKASHTHKPRIIKPTKHCSKGRRKEWSMGIRKR
jgi:hypothetical protein